MLVWIWIATAIVVFPLTLLFTAPYGRHSKQIGVMVPNKLAWIIMELPSPALFSYFFWAGNQPKSATHYVFFSLFLMHYVNRTFIWPLRTRTNNKKMPLLIMCSAFFFNCVNGPINGYFLGYIATYDTYYLASPLFIVGLLFFIVGFGLNVTSDNHLIKLRKSGETGYQIPRGGMFEFISCPNLFGEMLEWMGWAIMTWNLATCSFVLWTWVNLLPRALDHHKWYKQTFQKEYPPKRKAVLPGLL